VAVVYSLASMDTSTLQPSPPTQRSRGQLREGFHYVAAEPRLLIPLLMALLVGGLAWEFQVTLPVFAAETFHGNAATYGFLTAATGFGAVLGGLVTATRGRTGMRAMTLAAAAFGVTMLCTAWSPLLALAFVAMTATGWAAVTFIATGNTTIQLEAAPSMRGRVMGLWAVSMNGSTPVGGPFIGWIVQITNARVGLTAGGLGCLLASGIGLIAVSRLHPQGALVTVAGDDIAQGR
jgi:MFS family permease